MQDLNDIYYFVQVVEQGSFTAASKALGLAKSQLSFRIARLEQNLGVRLIQRTTRRSHVTDIGRLYYEQCLQILAAAQQAQRVIEDTQAAPRGRIHVGCPVMFAQLLLAPVLVDYLRQHPQVQVDLDLCGHQTDVVASGFDIAFRVRQAVKDSSLVVRSFGMDPQILVASPALLKRPARPKRPEDLQRIPSVSVAGTDGRHFWTLLGSDGKTHPVEHHPRLVTDDLQVLYQAVTGGVGMAQLPHWLCREPIARGQLVPLLPAYKLPPGNVHAVYPSRHGHTSAVRSFIDFVAEKLPLALQHAQLHSHDNPPRPAQAVALH
ncbi:hypothetical protein ASG87_17335 [Frateuria sp. Soil773]|uniref:LysR substrate-binding domain-containing protein n=1 Tax=Frateuria sp. Soil773 TaxID=1736407 RepID=UPI0006F37A4A|nr:LysR substrate-binding domain-containing protein [Frateuria sp. Soil773]KRE94879.1 hypothetical protein ASG87_17335 [Frateuria sp. Soil773]